MVNVLRIILIGIFVITAAYNFCRCAAATKFGDGFAFMFDFAVDCTTIYFLWTYPVLK
jgi:hypothetical protein